MPHSSKGGAPPVSDDDDLFVRAAVSLLGGMTSHYAATPFDVIETLAPAGFE
jgi:hypothetical protein